MFLDPAYALAGAVTGLVVGLTGVGGGALMTPILLFWFGVVPTTAVATDLWFAVITKLVGVTIHHRAGQVDWQVARRLWAGSLPIALAVVVYVGTAGEFAKMDFLTRAIGAAVLITALGLLLAPRLRAAALDGDGSSPADRHPSLAVVAGGALGLCVALTSVGAGALGSVMLLYLYPARLTPQGLVATDLVHAIPLAAVAGTGYLIAGYVDGLMLASLLAGSLPAVIVGSLLATRSPPQWLRVALAVVLGAAGAKALL